MGRSLWFWKCVLHMRYCQLLWICLSHNPIQKTFCKNPWNHHNKIHCFSIIDNLCMSFLQIQGQVKFVFCIVLTTLWIIQYPYWMLPNIVIFLLVHSYCTSSFPIPNDMNNYEQILVYNSLSMVICNGFKHLHQQSSRSGSVLFLIFTQ